MYIAAVLSHIKLKYMCNSYIFVLRKCVVEYNHNVYDERFEGGNFCCFHGLLLSASVLPLKFSCFVIGILKRWSWTDHKWFTYIMNIVDEP